MRGDLYDDWLARLSAWARTEPDVLGVVALGSTAGTERRPDEFSDHDVFVVTLDGRAPRYRDDVSWLPDAERLVLVHVETQHGRAALYDDGHLVELAVFDRDELDVAKVGAYRVLVDRDDLTARLAAIAARTSTERPPADRTAADAFAAFVQQIVVGAGRHARGEVLSANQRVRGFAVTELVRAVAALTPAGEGRALDGLDPHRRFEVAHPVLGARIAVALERPLFELADELVGVAEESLAGRVPAATPAVFTAVRSVLERARSPRA